MNLRCMYCQTMFGVSREIMLIGLQTMQAEKLTHYAIYCPKCRRANRVERRKLEIANPNWQEKIKSMAKEPIVVEKQATPKAKKPAPRTKAAPSTSKGKKVVKKKTPAKAKTVSKKVVKKTTTKAKKTAAKSTSKSKAKASTGKKSTSKKGPSKAKVK